MATPTHAKFPLVRIEHNDFVRAPKGCRGHVLWGPYQPLGPGDFEVAFGITPLDYEGRDERCCRIDVSAPAGNQILFQRDLTAGDLLDAQGRVTAPFRLTTAADVEFRVEALGGCGFQARYFRKALPAGRRERNASLEECAFYLENFAVASGLERGGVRFEVEDGALLARAGGLVLEVENKEDFQVINEVFLANDYTLVAPRPCIAFDIGMNVGFASLALAANPMIESVVGFEPFAAPFGRALRNLRRNPDVAAKVEALNVGLADRTEELDVASDPAATIGTSIRGLPKGQSERIHIQDAAGTLGPAISAAAARGLGVVMKIDCEGSEFAVFDSLHRAGLLGKIDAFMVEWHKWWSAEKTQADLIRPLSEAGFLVFDRTHPSDRYAGFFQAVRMERPRAA